MRLHSRLWIVAAFAITSLFAGCHRGGDSSSSSSGSSTTSATGGTLSGTAAVGAAISGGTVSAICSGGSPGTVATSSAGAFTINVRAGFSPPCILRVSGGTVNGAASPYVLHSLATGFGQINITSLTEMIVARAAAQQPSAVFDGYTLALGSTIAAALSSAQAYVRTGFAAVSGLSVPSVDFLIGPLAIGDAHDKFLDAIAAGLANAKHSFVELINAAIAGDAFASLLSTGTSGGGGGGGGGTGGGTGATSKWGSLTITGAAVPAGMQTTFVPNTLPTVTSTSVVWSNATLSSTSFDATALQTFTMNLLKDGSGEITNLRLAASPVGGAASSATINCLTSDCTAVNYTGLTRTLKLTNLVLSLGAQQITVNGTLVYPNLAAGAGTTVTNASVSSCPATTSPSSGEPVFETLMGCLAGTLKGFSDLGNVCTIAVDTNVRSVREVADDLDSTIAFVNQAGTTNLLHTTVNGAGVQTQTFAIRDPVSGTATTYRSIAIVVSRLTSGINAGQITIRAEGANRTGSAAGTITTRGACNVQL